MNSPVGGLNHRQLPWPLSAEFLPGSDAETRSVHSLTGNKFGLQISFLPTLKYHFLLRLRIQKHWHFKVAIAQAGSELHTVVIDPASENQYFQLTAKFKHGLLTTLEL